MKIRDLLVSAVFAALMCVISPFSFFIGAIPISLATFMVYLSGGALGAKRGTIAVFLYVALGALGLPVFSGFGGGIGQIAGVTGGYILGYILCGFTVGLMTEKIKKKWSYPVSMTIGTALCYGIGLIWFMLQTKINLCGAFLSGVLPFLLGDAIKIIFASILSVRLKNVLKG